MYTEGFDQWFKTNKNLAAPLAEFGKTTTEMYQRVMQQNLEILGENVTRYSEYLKSLSNVKSPEDLINLQRDWANRFSSVAMENMQKISHNAMANLEEVSKLWGATATKVSEKATAATDQVVNKAQRYTERSDK